MPRASRLSARGDHSIVVKKSDRLNFLILLKLEEIRQYTLRYVITFWLPNGKRAAILENDFDAIEHYVTSEYEVRAEMAAELLAIGEYYISFSLFDLNQDRSSENEKETIRVGR